MNAQRADHRERRGGEAHVEQVPPEREVEDIEADVDAELRIGDAEVDPVAEQQPLLPVRLAGQAGEESDHDRQQRDPQPDPGREQHPVALERLLLLRGVAHQRAQPEAQVEVATDERAHGEPEQQEQPDLGTQDPAEDTREADLVEPQPVGPQIDYLIQKDQQQESRADHGERDLAPAADSGH